MFSAYITNSDVSKSLMIFLQAVSLKADHFITDDEHVIPQGASYDDIITILTQK